MKTHARLSARQPARPAGGSALVITLTILALVTMMTVGLFSILMTERISASGNVETVRAQQFAHLGADHAVSLIRQAIANTGASAKPDYTWASQPGRIAVFRIRDGTLDESLSRALLSGTIDDVQIEASRTGTGSCPGVNLNEPLFGGKYPIASPQSVTGTSGLTVTQGPEMWVKWINIPQDPAAAVSASNPIVGRYAFWVDDNSARVNINTADGTSKDTLYIPPSRRYFTDWAMERGSELSPGNQAERDQMDSPSFGAGTPVEVDLATLLNSSLGDDQRSWELARLIAQHTGMRPIIGGSGDTPKTGIPFNTPGELLMLTGTGDGMDTFLQKNAFSLTTYNRSPELNMFGEPKMYLMQAYRRTDKSSLHNLLLGPYSYNNSMMFQGPKAGTAETGTPWGANMYAFAADDYEKILGSGPMTQIYPTSIPRVAPPIIEGTNGQLPSAQILKNYQLTSGSSVPLPQFFELPAYLDGNQHRTISSSGMGQPLLSRFAQYLNNKNSRGQTIEWPRYPGATGNGFTDKYTNRQLDSIILQLSDLMGAQFADQMRLSVNHSFPATVEKVNNINPLGGYLARQPVVGVGNFPRLTEIVCEFIISGNSKKPRFCMNMFMEHYIPKEYHGANDFASLKAYSTPNNATLAAGYGSMLSVTQHTNGVLNRQDSPVFQWQPNGTYNEQGEENTTMIIENPIRSGFGTYWQDTLLRVWDPNDPTFTSNTNDGLGVDPIYGVVEDPRPFLDEDNNPVPELAGTGWVRNSLVDFFGWFGGKRDPDQYQARFCGQPMEKDANGKKTGFYLGGGEIQEDVNNDIQHLPGNPLLTFNGQPFGYDLHKRGAYSLAGLRPGYYQMIVNVHNNKHVFFKKPHGNTVKITGGFSYWTHSGSGGGRFYNIPLDSIRGYVTDSTTGAHCTGEGDANRDGYIDSTQSDSLSPDVPNMRERLIQAVIPINKNEDGTYNDGIDLEVPHFNPDGEEGDTDYVGETHTYVSMHVVDPYVNFFPGDWIVKTGNSFVEVTSAPISELSRGLTNNFTDAEGNTVRFDAYNGTLVYTKDPDYTGRPPILARFREIDGAKEEFQAAKGGDPAGYWWPEQNAAMPKSRRLSSVGQLQYIHTGMFPDKDVEKKPYREWHGTPFRHFNFAPADDPSQKTDGGESYPDWAMLDLFTVPATFQPMDPRDPLHIDNCPPPINLTWGGATTGRMNPNSAFYPEFKALRGSAMVPVVRTNPLAALFANLQVSTEYDGDDRQQMEKIEADTAQEIARAVANYQRSKGRPFMLPGEISNVGRVADYLYRNNGFPERASRNDLVRQVIGNLSTQSNVFTVYAVGQTVRQKGLDASGNPICVKQGESRMQFVVERYMDYGEDGIPGNSSTQAGDRGDSNLIGAPDNKTNARLHPQFNYPLPYKYRILSVSEMNP